MGRKAIHRANSVSGKNGIEEQQCWMVRKNGRALKRLQDPGNAEADSLQM
jgi:hypothetical protein